MTAIGDRDTNSSYLIVMGALSMFINGGVSREGEIEETRRLRTKSRDGEMAQIGLKRNEPSPLTGGGKKEVDVLEHRSKVSEPVSNLPQARRTGRLGLVTKGWRRGRLKTDQTTKLWREYMHAANFPISLVSSVNLLSTSRSELINFIYLTNSMCQA